MQLIRALLCCALLLTASVARADSPTRAVTPRGAAVEVIAERPAGAGPFPAVILAAGAGYHMRLPIMEQTARALVAQGIAVYRFDWAYRVAGTDPARQPADHSAEIEDMQTVVALARQDPRIDRSRLVAGGKSLGSIIAWQVLRRDPELKGGLFLTPPCRRANADAGAGNFPGLDAEPRSRLWIVGDTDPLCPVPSFHRLFAAGGQPDRVVVLSGDHSFEVPDQPARNARTLDLVARLAADFVATLLRR